MIYKLRHIFVFLFVFSVFSLTLQSSIINLCKDSKVFKSQNNPITEEEEEESHDADGDADEVLYIVHDYYFIKPPSLNKVFWSKSEIGYLSFTKSIPIPPPKF